MSIDVIHIWFEASIANVTTITAEHLVHQRNHFQTFRKVSAVVQEMCVEAHVCTYVQKDVSARMMRSSSCAVELHFCVDPGTQIMLVRTGCGGNSSGAVETHLPSSVAKEVATTSKSLRQKHHPPRVRTIHKAIREHALFRRARTLPARTARTGELWRTPLCVFCEP